MRGRNSRAIIYRPQGNGPFPAVVALHNCDGLAGQRTPFARRYRDWGERFVAAGYVVLFPDSFGARNLGPQCNTGRSLRSGRERVADAEAARHWLQQQDYVAADRVSLIGWANGAVAALWTVRPRTAKKDDKPDFRSAIAFYPGCRRLRDTAWSARMPTLILIGAKDDWTPANACEQMVAGARGTHGARLHHGLSRRLSRLRPSGPAAAAAQRRCALHRRIGPRPCGQRPGRTRGCAQARRRMARALDVFVRRSIGSLPKLGEDDGRYRLFRPADSATAPRSRSARCAA